MRTEDRARAPRPAKLPVLFVSHGSPLVALEEDSYTEALRRWPMHIPRPAAIVVVSAHWQAPRPVRVATSPAPTTIHDFYGFPPELYALLYAPAGAPELAAAIVERLREAGIAAEADPGRGLDHGAWVPLRFLYPRADVPVVAVSLAAPAQPRELLALGQALASSTISDGSTGGAGPSRSPGGRRRSTTGSGTGSARGMWTPSSRTSVSRRTCRSPSRPASISTRCSSPSAPPPEIAA